MYKRPQVFTPDPFPVSKELREPSRNGAGKWFHFSNLKFEATVFMLIALTFAAVLGQEAVTSKELNLSARAAQYFPFVYGDYQEGGKSSVQHDDARPLDWSCSLRPGAQYAYCGYGLHLDVTNTNTGLDFSKYQSIRLRLNYKGTGDHLRLVIQTAVPDTLGIESKPGNTIPLVAEFNVVNGDNEIELKMDQFTVESWWLTSHKLTPDQVKPPLEKVISVGFSSGSETPHGDFSVSIKDFRFEGTSLSTAQWYLVILGVWLVLTGAFLVYRFLDMRRAYEARQRRLAEQQAVLAKAHAAAEQASAAKSQFLANMSHELRTPLNAIIGYAQLLKNGELTEQQLSATRTIQHSGEHLLSMITDILDIAKVEAGKLELMPAAFDIRACILNIGQMVRLRAEEKGLAFAVNLADDVPQTVTADQKRIRQVLINLLGNAIKFTSAGEVRLDVSVIFAAETEACLRFDIRDTGIGIGEDQIGRIFRPFEQAGNAIDRSGGTGLGLSITHQIVEMMGGEISVESTPGQGSCFSVELLLPLASGAAEDVPVLEGLGENCSRYEILVADDTEASGILLQTALETQGFRVRYARNGAEAIDLIKTSRPDLVLMDLRMPVMDGLEAIRSLRASPVTQNMPIIALSANPSADKEATALEAGANRMLPKPVDLKALHACIAELLKNSATSANTDENQPIIAPDGEVLERLLAFARAGNLRAIRKEIPAIVAADSQHKGFAERLDALAATYQSPAVLRLIEHHAQEKRTAA